LFILSNNVPNPTKLSILCQGVIKPPALGCGKLGRDNIEEAILGVSMECLFQSNGDHTILVPRFMLHSQKYCWNPTKSSILRQGVDEAPVLGCGKLDRDNSIEEAILGVSMECLFQSNGDHILVPRLCFILRNIVGTQQNPQFFAKERVDKAPGCSRLRQARLGQYREGSARCKHGMSFLVKWRPFYHSNLMVPAQKYSLKLNEILNSL
jgi:hypothetical protein